MRVQLFCCLQCVSYYMLSRAIGLYVKHYHLKLSLLCSIPEEDMQFIGDGILIAVNICVGILIVAALFCMAWVTYYRVRSQLGMFLEQMLRCSYM